jgi:hypothetical protein
VHSLHYERGTPAYRRALATDVYTYLIRLPISYLESRLLNPRLHDLSNGTLVLPASLLPLLAYGTKFCPTPPCPGPNTIRKAIFRLRRQVLWHKFWQLNPSRPRPPDPARHLRPRAQTNLPEPLERFPILTQLNVELTAIEADLAPATLLANSRLYSRCRNLPRGAMPLLHEARASPDFVIRNADKNMGLCIIPTSMYRDMGNSHLRNNNAYAVINPADTSSVLQNAHLELECLLTCNQSALSNQQRTFILDYALPGRARFPQFHFSPKLHKSPMGVRPLLGAHSAPTTGASKFLGVWLRHLLRRHIDHTVQHEHKSHFVLLNSTSLLVSLDRLKLPPQCVLVSFDIESLYPSLPFSLIFESLAWFLGLPSLSCHCPLSMRSLLRALASFVLRHCYGHFDGVHYRQTLGLAMGTNAAVELATIAILFLESKPTVEPLIRRHTCLYSRYIDDGFAILPSMAELPGFQLCISQLLPGALRFTWHVSADSLDFLDLHLSKGARFRQLNLLDSRTHQKVLNTYQYLPLSSCHPLHVKTSWIRAELLRHVRNCSDLDDYLSMSQLFCHRLRARGYPPKLLRRLFTSVHYESRPALLGLVPRPDSARTSNADKDTATLVLPFSDVTKNNSRGLRQLLQQHTPTLLQHYSIRIAWTVPPHLGGHFMRMEFPNPDINPNPDNNPTP